mmetsp:Transcript_26481/g.41487  ORF Transcript_26481/g.41487 Transcript_26481/m.41487 type:complete len:673 (+) Transcript_26481:866-2884(+)
MQSWTQSGVAGKGHRPRYITGAPDQKASHPAGPEAVEEKLPAKATASVSAEEAEEILANLFGRDTMSKTGSEVITDAPEQKPSHTVRPEMLEEKVPAKNSGLVSSAEDMMEDLSLHSGLPALKRSSSSIDSKETNRPDRISEAGREVVDKRVGMKAMQSMPVMTSYIRTSYMTPIKPVDNQKGLLINETDFKGSRVLQNSFVRTSSHLILARPSSGEEGIATAVAKGSDTWLRVRDTFLLRKEAELRIKLRSTMDTLREAVFTLQPGVMDLDVERLLVQWDEDQADRILKVECLLQAIRSKTIELASCLVSGRTQCSLIGLDRLPPPPTGPVGAAVERWIVLFQNAVDVGFGHIITRAAHIEEALDFLEEGRGKHPAALRLIRDEEDFNTYVCRRAPILAMSSLDEQVQELFMETNRLTYLRATGSVSSFGEELCSHVRVCKPDAWRIVSQCSLFQPMRDDSEAVAAIVDALQPVLFDADATMMQKGTIGSYMLFIASGSCKIVDGNKTLGFRGPGDMVGEISLVYPTERTANVMAVGVVEAFQLSRNSFAQIAKLHPQVRDHVKKVSDSKLHLRKWKVRDINVNKKGDVRSSIEEQSLETASQPNASIDTNEADVDGLLRPQDTVPMENYEDDDLLSRFPALDNFKATFFRTSIRSAPCQLLSHRQGGLLS